MKKQENLIAKISLFDFLKILKNVKIKGFIKLKNFKKLKKLPLTREGDRRMAVEGEK